MSIFVSLLLFAAVAGLCYAMFRQSKRIYALAAVLIPHSPPAYQTWLNNVAYVAIGALAVALLSPTGASPVQQPVNVGLPTPYPTMQRREPTVLPTSTPRPLPTETSTSLEYKPDVILKIDTMMLTATPTATPTFVPTLQASPTLSPTEVIAIVATPTTEIPIANPGQASSSSVPIQPSSASSSVVSSAQSSQSSIVSSSSQNSVVRSSAASSSVIAPPASSSSSAISIQSSSAEPGGGGGSRSSKSQSTKSGLTLPGTNAPLNLGSFIPGLIVLATAILAAYGVRIT